MSDSETILSCVLDFFASDTWWSQILDFMLSRCEPFHQKPDISFEEYGIYMEFINFIEKLLYGNVCEQIGISPEKLENTILQALQNQNEKAISIRDTLFGATDIITFRSDMISHNERIEKEVQNVMNKNFNNPDESLLPNQQAQNQQQVPPIHFSIHEPSAMHQPQGSQLPHIEIKSPRNPRFCTTNKQPMIPHPPLIPHRPTLIAGDGQLPGILSRKKETLQSMQTGVPALKIPKPVAVKLPPLGKSPRF